jgi:hypothetical protein
LYRAAIRGWSEELEDLLADEDDDFPWRAAEISKEHGNFDSPSFHPKLEQATTCPCR